MFYFSGSPPRLACFILEGSCRIMSLNIPETFLCRDVYASFGSYQVLPKLLSLAASGSQHRAASYLRCPGLAFSATPWLALARFRAGSLVQTSLTLCKGCHRTFGHLLQSSWQELLILRGCTKLGCVLTLINVRKQLPFKLCRWHEMQDMNKLFSL